jgi:uncharacterized protein YndB with AHSA1/START domain
MMAETLSALYQTPLQGVAGMRIVTTTQIDRPIEQVFDFLTTPANWVRWHPSTVSVSGATDHSLEVGEQVTEEYVVAGQKGRATWTVRERSRPHRWKFDTIAENGHQAAIAYTFTPLGYGTHFEREVVIQFPPTVPEAIQAEFEKKLAAESAEALRCVKKALETA